MPASMPSPAVSLPGATAFAQPYTTVDLVIFTLIDDRLKVLLARRPDDREDPFPGRWCLPGGFVDVERDESLAACAARKLHEKTQLVSPYLEQLGSWGGRARDPRGWSATHVYFALVASEGLQLREGGNASALQWFDAGSPRQTGAPETSVDGYAQADAVPGPRVASATPAGWLAGATEPLAFDHGVIVQAAIERLRGKVEYTSLPAFLLPEPFTLPQLQRVYEAILERPLDKSAFRTRMLAAGFLNDDGVVQGDSNRPAKGYRLRDRTQSVVFPRTFRAHE